MDRFNVWVGARSSPRSARRTKGQTFVEYALVLSVIVVGVLLAATWGGLVDRHRHRDRQGHDRDRQRLHG